VRGLVVSTIYLPMGLKKSWIMEYWTAGGDKTPAKGGTGGVEAPWPYLMFRPEAELPPDADAVLVRGSLNAEGQLGG
jgi:hypothetical protein